MKEEELLKAYEDLHREYYALHSSREYAIGTKITLITNAIKGHRFLTHLKQEWKWRMLARYVHSQPKSDYEYGAYPTPRPLIAVYTCITGGYDNLEIPRLKFANIDYIFYTDNPGQTHVDKWEVRPLPKEALAYSDNADRNRYCKMHPAIVGDGYDYAIYIDGNIRVYSDVTNMINTINPMTGLSFHRHSDRICLYEEVKFLCNAKRGNVQKMREQAEKYEDEGMPHEYGLLECPVILTDLRNGNASKLLDSWWKEYLISGSRRDQISFPYILWKNGYKVEDIGNLGNHISLNPKFRKVKHAREKGEI